MTMEIDAIVFDFDGVLVESVSVKGAAFVELYKDESPEIQAQVRAYHEAHGGVTRFDKIRHYEALCGRKVDEGGVMELADKFSDIVERQVVESAWVPGALEFLQGHSAAPLYVASATPQEELERIVAARGIAGHFRGVFGAPVKKVEHLGHIIAADGYKADRVLMVGDAMTDYNAAQTAQTRFIGRQLPGKDLPFPAGTIVIQDLTELAGLIKLPV